MSDTKKQKHRCPALPEEFGKITPDGWNGEDAAKAKAMWYAWLRKLNYVRPVARRTH